MVSLDEAPLRARVRSMFAALSATMQEQQEAGVPKHEAQQRASFELNAAMQRMFTAALLERDRALLHYAKRGADALSTLQRVGGLSPPWLLTCAPSRPVRQQLEELEATMDSNRDQREYNLRARIVRTVTAPQYALLRPSPESMWDAELAHIIRCEAAALSGRGPGWGERKTRRRRGAALSGT